MALTELNDRIKDEFHVSIQWKQENRIRNAGTQIARTLNTLDDVLVLEQSEAGCITFKNFILFFCQGPNNKYFRHVEHPDSIAMT